MLTIDCMLRAICLLLDCSGVAAVIGTIGAIAASMDGHVCL
jgi:hypothetical protein